MSATFALRQTGPLAYYLNRRHLYACPQEVKEAAYNGLVRAVLEYNISVLDPSCVVLQDELEKVHNRVTRYVTGNCNYETVSITDILEHLKWESLEKSGRYSRFILLYRRLKGKASIPKEDIYPPVRCCRNHQSLEFQVPIANTDFISVAPRLPPPTHQNIRDWNARPDPLIFSAGQGWMDRD